MESLILPVSFFLIALSLIGTLWVAKDPGAEKKYSTKTVGNFTRLTWFYVIITLIMLLIFLFV
ncbi:hypothetical protein BEP19_16110 [Ammoniphilus oxalaticus]|uniref:Uncharacterized protein n=1 Tax=Ammoniphilus oxalaticus TaxID=66863 RepID=A0A419SQP4_9BACL|nr:hypothetical protein [Ammoniphilus oxalaticus]RKD26725.1 hypothetical protein BEP19_16110 [Ammoniphilus oxalaticus]